MPHPRLVFSGLLFAACFVAAPRALAAGVNACSVVTKAELEAAVGKPITVVTSAEPGAEDISSCSYRTTDGSAKIGVRLSPKVGDREHAAFPFLDPKPVTGLGDDAKFAENAVTRESDRSNDAGSALSVRKGKAAVAVFYRGSGDRLAISRAVAEKALSRL